MAQTIYFVYVHVNSIYNAILGSFGTVWLQLRNGGGNSEQKQVSSLGKKRNPALTNGASVLTTLFYAGKVKKPFPRNGRAALGER